MARKSGEGGRKNRQVFCNISLRVYWNKRCSYLSIKEIFFSFVMLKKIKDGECREIDIHPLHQLRAQMICSQFKPLFLCCITMLE